MKRDPITRRLFVESALTTLALAGCGGSGRAESSDTATSGPVPAPPPPPPPAAAPPPPPPPVATATIATVRLQASGAGPLPFSATVLPLEGEVPLGSTLVSPDDGALVASVLSRWTDNSAAVIVVASTATLSAGESRDLRLQRSTAAAARPDLGPALIGQLVRSVSIDCGPLGRVDLQNFSAPERTWWANAQTVCARYRAAFSGHATLEAVVDIQAWAGGRALVEVVVENCKMASSAPIKPAAASYTAAVVTVNGAVVTTVNGNGTPEGNHSAFRAWYARSWVGGDPGVRATQSHTDLQRHPLLFKIPEASNVDFSVYAADVYTPWSTVRQRASGMGAGGDHASIGPLPQWEARYLQSGDARAAQATEANALAVLGYNVNYRDSTTGLVPTFSEIGAKLLPRTTNASEAMTWETAHHPAAGLMAFIVRPSPVYMEIAQKVAVWNGTWSSGGNGAFTWTSGVFGHWYQTRGKAWGIRSLAHATFLTPNSLPWRAAGAAAIKRNAELIDTFRTDPKQKLGLVWDYSPTSLNDHASNSPHFQIAAWQHHYLVTELHKAARARLLTGTDQTSLAATADWAAAQPVRWINERANGGWRYVPYSTAVSPSKSMTDSPTTWGEEMALFMTDTPVSTGSWATFYNNVASSYGRFEADAAGASYVSYFVAALAAAVERDVPGATTAWQTMLAGVTNHEIWRRGFARDPRWGATPRVD